VDSISSWLEVRALRGAWTIGQIHPARLKLPSVIVLVAGLMFLPGCSSSTMVLPDGWTMLSDDGADFAEDTADSFDAGVDLADDGDGSKDLQLPDTAMSDTGFDEPQAAFNRDFFALAKSIIDASTSRVHVIEYVLYNSGSSGTLIRAIADAADRGVEVKVLADEAGDSSTQEALNFLDGRGVITKLDSPNVTTHNKLIIADDKTIVGSTNFTTNAISYNNEASVLISDPRVTAYYESFFQALWLNSEQDPVLSKADTYPVTPIKNRELVGYLESCLLGAGKQVRLVLYAACYSAGYSDEESDYNRLLTRIIEAQERGVDVKVILDHSDWIVSNQINNDAVAYLLAAGVDVSFAPSSVVTHAKALRCDDTVLITDENWCYSGLHEYNGTSAQITTQNMVDAYDAWFLNIWNQSTPAL